MKRTRKNEIAEIKVLEKKIILIENAECCNLIHPEILLLFPNFNITE